VDALALRAGNKIHKKYFYNEEGLQNRKNGCILSTSRKKL